MVKTSFLMPSSAHPSHVTGNIPFSIADRLRRICWSDESFELRLTEMCSELMARGNKQRSVLDSFDKVRKIPRAEAIKKVTRDREFSDRARFVIKFDPRLPDIRSILKGAWSVMTEDKEMKRIVKAPNMVFYQKMKSLGEMLVRVKLPVNGASCRPRRGQGDGFKPC